MSVQLTNINTPIKLYNGLVEIHGDSKFQETILSYFKEIENNPIGSKALKQFRSGSVLTIRQGDNNRCKGNLMELNLDKINGCFMVSNKTFVPVTGPDVLFHEIHHYLHFSYGLFLPSSIKAQLLGYERAEEQCAITGLRENLTNCPLGHCQNAYEQASGLPIRQYWTCSAFDTIDFDPHQINKDGLTRLHDAAQSGALVNLEKLLWNGGNPNIQDPNGRTPLHYAATIDADAAGLLIRYGANCNARDNDGKTPLFFAATNRNPAAINLFLSHGVTLNITDNNGNSIFLHAVKEKNCDMVMHLLQIPNLYINVYQPNKLGRTALHICEDLSIAKKLLQNGFNIEAKDKNGMTPLQVAIKNDNFEMVKFFLEEGKADPRIRDNNGLSALDYARQIPGQKGQDLLDYISQF